MIVTNLYCRLVAVSLHLFLLSTFTWSLLAAHQIYVLLVQVFDSAKTRHRQYFLFGYTIPVAVVAVSLLTDHATGSGY